MPTNHHHQRGSSLLALMLSRYVYSTGQLIEAFAFSIGAVPPDMGMDVDAMPVLLRLWSCLKRRCSLEWDDIIWWFRFIPMVWHTEHLALLATGIPFAMTNNES